MTQKCNCQDCGCGCKENQANTPCGATQSKLEELLRDELCSEESAPIRAHLRECVDCRQEQRVCEALTDAVKRGCREKAPLQLRDAILDALNLG